ncbi:MAG: SagB/ThcOx family dehydrogenase [Dehalococcoidia bacterium]
MWKVLPPPEYESEVTIEESIMMRRSVRNYTDEPLRLEEVSQLLWAAQGLTAGDGRRTAPSAGALYPLEVYLVAGHVQGLVPGVYHYEARGHQISDIVEGDVRAQMAGVALGQSCVRDGAIDIVFTAVHERINQKYGYRGARYTYMEAGHAAQNVCLQAAAMNLGVVTIGAFNDEELSRVLNLPGSEEPVYIIAAGRK